MGARAKSIRVRELFETEEVKKSILSKSYKELGMNKSTLVSKGET